MNYKENVKKNNFIAYQIIENAFNKNKISHAYLFNSSFNQKIEDEYLFLIEKIIWNEEIKRNPKEYSDLNIIDCLNEKIKKENIIEIIRKLQETALDSLNKKILVIKNIEKLNIQSSNSILKFIEEPTKNTYIIMTTNNLNQILPTIKSRSQIINCNQSKKENIEIKNIKIKLPNYIQEIINTKNFDKLYEYIINILNNSINNKNKIIYLLNPLIDKEFYLQNILLLKEFFNDIWRKKSNLEICFTNKEELIEKYIEKKFKFDLAIKNIDEFIFAIKNNINFILAKNNLLIKLKECYE